MKKRKSEEEDQKGDYMGVWEDGDLSGKRFSAESLHFFDNHVGISV